MTDQILDYTIGPVGRSVLTAGTHNTIPRGSPGTGYNYPCSADSESTLIEIPEADMFQCVFSVQLSRHDHTNETYERFDRGALQYLRPEHAASQRMFPAKRTTELYITSDRYFSNVRNEILETGDRVQAVVMSGGDTAQYSRYPYMHLQDPRSSFGGRLLTIPFLRLVDYRKFLVVKFLPDHDNPPLTQSHLPLVPRCPTDGPALRSDLWFDSVQILFNQWRDNRKILTLNFRFIEHANDNGTQVVPLLFDVTGILDEGLIENHQEGVLTHRISLKLRKVQIPVT